ncbi:ATP synthase subunit I [Pseudomarimonas arenosa]|uniref:ATP synthase subunit I n=1 Tax=Pseudomarimonas arenosa TaxID=2774145 RepID=A0AAW3ZGE3_9GAMM|nr:ATP synthase subunit I [Pseudomarimonas arenosa]
MLNSLAAGRRQATQQVLAQCAVAALLTLAFAVQGLEAALSAAVGGFAVVLGNALMAWRSFAGGVAEPGTALFRLFGGIALKWLVIVLSLYLGLARFGLLPLPLLAGLSATLVASLLAYRIKS